MYFEMYMCIELVLICHIFSLGLIAVTSVKSFLFYFSCPGVEGGAALSAVRGDVQSDDSL